MGDYEMAFKNQPKLQQINQSNGIAQHKRAHPMDVTLVTQPSGVYRCKR
jgi:hypothetical protein